jgi:hypothetical protein
MVLDLFLSQMETADERIDRPSATLLTQDDHALASAGDCPLPQLNRIAFWLVDTGGAADH